VTSWLRRCPTWQFVLIWAAVMALGCVVGGLVGALIKQHLDWSELVGLAAGGALGASLMAFWFRQNQQRS
jgi:uncharacterized membrane protein YfcA